MARTKIELRFKTRAQFPPQGSPTQLYIVTSGIDVNKMYRWDGSDYIEVGGGGGGSGTVTEVDTGAGLTGGPITTTGTIALDASSIASLALADSSVQQLSGSVTDNRVARYHLTTGLIIQDSGASIDDSGNITANNLSGTNTGDQTNITGNAGTVTTNANLTGPITSTGNATSIASQTGTGTKFVVDTSPTLVTPNIGVATATSVNKVALTAPATGSTITIIDGKTLTANNSIGITGTDGTTMKFTTTSSTLYKELFAFVTGSNATTTSTSLVDITGLSIAVEANSTYMLEARLSTGTSADTTGTKYAIAFSASGASFEGGVIGTTTSTSDNNNRFSTIGTATSQTFMTTSGNTTGNIFFKGVLTTGANAGNVTVKHLKVTSGTSTVFINSSLEVKKVS